MGARFGQTVGGSIGAVGGDGDGVLHTEKPRKS
jgi:hypothetical protein